MTKVLILSDSHGLTDELAAIKEKFDLKYSIHCGDSELGMDAPEMEDFYKVAGNCDFDARYPEDHKIEIGGLTFYITHGHLHNVKSNLNRLSYHAEEAGANVICFGHTHVAGAEKIGDQLFINPGSILQPRNRPEKTFAVMEWDEPSDISINFYTTDFQLVDELSLKVSL